MESVVARDEKPHVGDVPPDFSLKQMGSEERVQLSKFKGQKPVALIFGSSTCPPFRAQVEHMENSTKSITT